MALTPEGTPYVESSDLVANYPAASLALANRVDLVGVLPFATSAARATAIPSPTDGQYTYLQDTNSTEFWNGSAWQTAGVTPGLNLITPTSIANSGGSASASGGAVTFTAVNSISLNGVFTSTYDNYRIIFSGLGSSSGADVSLRLRNAGTDLTAATYDWVISRVNYAGTQTLFGSTLQTSFGQISNISTYLTGFGIDMFNPFATAFTSYYGLSQGISASVGGLASIHGLSRDASSYSSFSLIAGTGTITGIIRVYGYKNS
jgi:hypothetical protein